MNDVKNVVTKLLTFALTTTCVHSSVQRNWGRDRRCSYQLHGRLVGRSRESFDLHPGWLPGAEEVALLPRDRGDGTTALWGRDVALRKDVTPGHRDLVCGAGA